MSEARVPRFCHLCGRTLAGRFYRYAHGLVVCSACERTLPRCARCNVPLAGAEAPEGEAQAGGPPICRQCLRTAPRCACCGKPVAQTWYTFEELLPPPGVRRFCEPCVKHRRRCDVCRAPVPEGATTLPDGQFRCTLCATDMVLDSPAAAAVYAEARALAEQVTHVRLHQTPALSMIGRREMGAVRRRVPTDLPDGASGQHVLGFFEREGSVTRIYVELGLPRPLMLGTLAHEVAHAWQAEVAPEVADPLLREGFAEWVAHRVLVAGGHRRVAARATRRDDVYGRGLRHFLELERAKGRTGVIDAALGVPSPSASPAKRRG